MMTASMPRILPGNAQNRGDRDYQEDAFGFTDRNDPSFVRHAGVAAVLCDGMGGLQFGAESATLAVDTFLDEYKRKLPSETPGAGLKRAALRANDAVFRFARENGVVQRTGCTLVAVVARGVELHCIHAGDSRAYLFSDGHLERLTIDHTYARRLELQVAQGQIRPEDAAEHPNRDHLTSNLGRQDLTELDLLEPPRKLAPNDWILLCSDGLHGMLSDDEIAAELHGNSQDAAQRLVKRVTDRPEPEKDNVTIVIMQVGVNGALVPSHHTWQSGRHASHSPAKALCLDPSAIQSRASAPPMIQQSKRATPRWLWPLTVAPLLLALATWAFWPAPAPTPNTPPVTSGFTGPLVPKGPSVPGGQPVNRNAHAFIQDLPTPSPAAVPQMAAKLTTAESATAKAKAVVAKPGKSIHGRSTALTPSSATGDPVYKGTPPTGAQMGQEAASTHTTNGGTLWAPADPVLNVPSGLNTPATKPAAGASDGASGAESSQVRPAHLLKLDFTVPQSASKAIP